jgi:hypothetical protein
LMQRYERCPNLVGKIHRCVVGMGGGLGGSAVRGVTLEDFLLDESL